VKHDPYKDLLDLQEKLHRLLLGAFRHSYEPEESAGGWSPPMDVYETREGIVVLAELPGLTRTDIDIRIDGGNLVLKGERSLGKNPREENYLRIERHYGAFARTIVLPASADVDHIEANLRDGVLEVRIPRTEEVKPSSLKVPIN